MNILFFITKKNGEATSAKTIESIKSNLKEGDKFFEAPLSETAFYQQLYCEFNQLASNKDKFDFIVIVPNHSYLQENYKEIAQEYVDYQSKNNVYLPFNLLISEDNTKGLLNTSMWTNYALSIGELDHELALGQTDTVLFGALIPFHMFFDEEHYNKDLKYYQHYHFINSITSKEEYRVFGIPKLLLNLDYDLAYNHINKDEKIINYKLAREKFVKALNAEMESEVSSNS